MAGILGLLGGSDPQGGGLLGNLDQYVGDNNSALLGMGLGLLGGQGTADGWNQAMRGYLQGEQQDSVRRQLQQKHNEQLQKKAAAQAIAQKMGVDPTLAQADPDTVLGLYSAVQQKRLTPKEYSMEESYLRNLQKTDPQRFQQVMDAKVGGGAGGYGLNPVYGTDAEGNPVIMQIGKNGQAVQTALPNGVKLSKEPIKLDAGTHFVLIDPISRQPVGTIPKNVAGEAAARKQGEALGTEIAGADASIATAEQTIKEIQALRTHPGREWATGKTSWLPSPNGSEKKNFDVRVAQLKGKTFLQAYQGMKGTGAISEAEGAKAEAAIARLDTGQTEEAFLEALDDLESVVKSGMERIKRRTSGGTSSPNIFKHPSGATIERID